MSDKEQAGWLDWFGLRRVPDLRRARWLGRFAGVVLCGLAGGLVALYLLAVFAAFVVVGDVIRGTAEPGAGLRAGALVTLVLGAPFVIWRAIVAQRSVDVAEQGHITDRINKAVEGLGAEKTVKRDGVERSEPNLEVRIGAIHALERIAQDSDRDHVQIMEILCAYVRENAPAREAKDWPELEMQPGEEDGPLEVDWTMRFGAFREAQEEALKDVAPRTDVQQALTVIGRRSAHQRRLEARWGEGGPEAEFVFDLPCPEPEDYLPEQGHDPEKLRAYLAALDAWKKKLEAYRGYRLDLRGANLQGADLSGLNLNGARLDGCEMQGMRAIGTEFQGASLLAAELQGATLLEVKLQGANLALAWMQTAGLEEARMQRAVLWRARLEAARLTRAQMQGANLELTRMQRANLGWARMQGVDARQARMQGAFLTGARTQGALLWGAKMQRAKLEGTDLSEAQMHGAVLWGAQMRGACLKGVEEGTVAALADHLEEMFGDGSVRLPEGVARPRHWPEHELGFDEFEEEWRRWLADPDGYVPPRGRAG